MGLCRAFEYIISACPSVRCVFVLGAASDGGLFVYNILLGLHASLRIVKEAIFRYKVTSIYDKIIVNCDRMSASLARLKLYYRKPRKG